MQFPPTEDDYVRAGRATLGLDDAPQASAAASPDLADDPTLDGGGRATAPRIVNVALASSLNEPGALVLVVDGRQHAYRMPATPFVEGARLYHFEGLIGETWAALSSLTDKNPHTNPEAERCLRALVLAYAEAAAILWRLVEPITVLGRLRWRLGGRPTINPFLRLDFAQMQQALRFFSGARTNSRLAWISSARAPRSLTWTSPATSSPIGATASAPAPAMGTR